MGRLRTSREPVETHRLAIESSSNDTPGCNSLDKGVTRHTLDNVQIGVPLAVGVLVAAHAGITLKVDEGTKPQN